MNRLGQPTPPRTPAELRIVADALRKANSKWGGAPSYYLSDYVVELYDELARLVEASEPKDGEQIKNPVEEKPASTHLRITDREGDTIDFHHYTESDYEEEEIQVSVFQHERMNVASLTLKDAAKLKSWLNANVREA